jgi:hypothetical protein
MGMEKRAGKDVRHLLAVVIVASLLMGSIAATHSQTPNGTCEYFTETGHYVCDEFLEFFETRGGLEIFGYPLTEAFDDPVRGLRVQYFQRARMELHPYNQTPYNVQLGLLNDELGYISSPINPDERPAFNSSVHHYFSETGHIVSYAFLKYFREKGGVDIFGYPRSEFMYEDGYIVQYFQRARMEWHPEAASGSQMHLTNIGEIYIEKFGLPGDYDEPQPPPARSGEEAGATPGPPVTSLDASASVRHVIMGRQGTQTVFVYVNDQRHDPVPGATVQAIVRYQSGDQKHTCDTTNTSGFAKCSFDIQLSPPGEKVVIDVKVDYGGITATTQTFFLPWW